MLQKLKKVFYTEGGILDKLEQYKILFSIKINYNELSIIHYPLSFSFKLHFFNQLRIQDDAMRCFCRPAKERMDKTRPRLEVFEMITAGF